MSQIFRTFIALTGLCSVNAWASFITYEVPNKDPQLSQYSQFVVDVSCERVGGALHVHYTYPAELIGVAAPVDFVQNPTTPTTYSSAQGEMSCENGTCAVTYKNLPLDLPALRERLHAVSKTKQEFNLRATVALHSFEDPGGTFSESPQEYCQK